MFVGVTRRSGCLRRPPQRRGTLQPPSDSSVHNASAVRCTPVGHWQHIRYQCSFGIRQWSTSLTYHQRTTSSDALTPATSLSRMDPYEPETSGWLRLHMLQQLWSDECGCGQAQAAVQAFFSLPHLYVSNAQEVAFYAATCQPPEVQRVFVVSQAGADVLQSKLEERVGGRLQRARPEEGDTFKQVLRIDCSTPGDFWKAHKAVAKVNKQLKVEAEDALADPCDFARSLVLEELGPMAFIGVDFEWWEKSAVVLLELGWSVWDNVTREHRSVHWIVKENAAKQNGQYVPNNRRHFLFGDSQSGSEDEAIQALLDEFATCGSHLPHASGERRRLVLVGHGLKEDLQLLEDFGLEVKKVCRHTLDTQKLAARRTGNLQIGLKGLLEAVGIRPQRLHNAGNDARFTMDALLALTGAQPTDATT